MHALRYYEKVGLLEAVPRLSSGHRRYSAHAAQRAEALGYLRASGLGIEDMRAYLRGVDRGDAAAADIAALLGAHADRITEELDRLAVRRDYIRAKADYWQAVAEGRADSERAAQSLRRAVELSELLT